ncbi:hypothetical protein GCM10022290_14540 [Sagittula marina]
MGLRENMAGRRGLFGNQPLAVNTVDKPDNGDLLSTSAEDLLRIFYGDAAQLWHVKWQSLAIIYRIAAIFCGNAGHREESSPHKSPK